MGERQLNELRRRVDAPKKVAFTAWSICWTSWT